MLTETSLNKNRNELLANGYTLVKGVFSPEEVEILRKKAYLSAGYDYVKTDLLSNPELRSTLLDDRISLIATQLLGDTPIYFGESKVLVDGVNGRNSSSIHKDNPDRDNPKGIDWKGEYRILRFAIYLQDHSKHSNGLTVRKGSHKTPSLMKGK